MISTYLIRTRRVKHDNILYCYMYYDEIITYMECLRKWKEIAKCCLVKLMTSNFNNKLYLNLPMYIGILFPIKSYIYVWLSIDSTKICLRWKCIRFKNILIVCHNLCVRVIAIFSNVYYLIWEKNLVERKNNYWTRFYECNIIVKITWNE